MGLGRAGLPAEVGVELAEVGRRVLAPAALGEAGGGDVEAARSGPDAVLHLGLRPPEAAAGKLQDPARVAESALELHRQGAGQGVQPEGRVGGGQFDPLDRHVRDQVPVHRVAERLVEPGPVDIDRQPLRRAHQRRGLEAAVDQVRLERVSLGVVQGHAAERPVQALQQRRPRGAGEGVLVHRLGGERQAVRLDLRPQRGSGHHGDAGHQRWGRGRSGRSR